MAKVKLGDIFEISTAKGKAYFQSVKIDKLRWDVIKVFNKLYNERPKSIKNTVDTPDYYFVGFALSAAFKKNLVEKVGNIPLQTDFEMPKYMRSRHIIRGEFLGWHITDTLTWKRQLVEKLSTEQKYLSPWGIWNDTLLKERLEDGWSLDKWE